jgi:group I intron endonuclease
MIGIYKITNTINNKVYIGQSIDIERRWKKESKLNGINQHLRSSFQKYGIENFKFEVLVECEDVDLDRLEIYWIDFYNSTDRTCGYNKNSGGSNGIPNEETRKKQSDAHKGKPSYNLGKKASEESKKKMSESHKKMTDETKRKMSESMKGKRLSDDTKRKIGEKLKGNKHALGYKHTPEAIEKIRHKSINLSEETRKKLSDKAKQQWERQKANKK